MTNKIYPCLWFDGQAKAAAELYCSVFSEAKIIDDTPMVVTFLINGEKFMGLNRGPKFKLNPKCCLISRRQEKQSCYRFAKPTMRRSSRCFMQQEIFLTAADGWRV